MRWHTIPPLVVKDLALFFRNRFFAFITVLGLVAYVGLYLAMPQTVDETIEIGLHSPSDTAMLGELLEEEGLTFLLVDTIEQLQHDVSDGAVMGGIVLPEGMMAQLGRGERPTVTILLASDTPQEMRDLMVILVETLALSLSGSPLNIAANEVTLGPVLAGNQIPPRERMLPLLAVMVLMMETMGLASLIAEERQARTLQALLVTPLGVGELFIGKGVTSVLLTFLQASLLMLAVGGLRHQPAVMLLTLLLGAGLVTGIGFLMASVGNDMLGVMGIGILVLIVLSIPPFGVIFPGSVTGWAKLIPSHYLAETVHHVANLGAGWSEAWQNLIILLGADILLFGLGVYALKRAVA